MRRRTEYGERRGEPALTAEALSVVALSVAALSPRAPSVGASAEVPPAEAARRGS